MIPHLRRAVATLDELPESVRIVVGNQPETFRQAGPEAGAILNCFQPVPVLRAASADALSG